MTYIYRVHAIERMFQRNISNRDVETCIEHGKIIESYKDDKPYPSFLALNFIDNKPLHVVFAYDDNQNTIIITTYSPNREKWQDDFKMRRVL